MGVNLKSATKLKSGKSGYICAESKGIIDQFLPDGCIGLSNNHSENAIRPYVTGRNAPYTTRGVKTSAIVYSMIE